MPRSTGTRAPHGEARSADARRARIRELNDQFRTTFIGGRIMVTDGVLDLPGDGAIIAILAVQDFTEFGAENDPYDEHDFGAVAVASHRVFWKIDYYDHRFEYGSPDPSLPGLTGRMITIMLASEY